MKKIILWNYARGTWQYDIFCLLIIAFIFLTPKTWFKSAEKTTTQTASSVVKFQVLPSETTFSYQNRSLRKITIVYPQIVRD